MLSGGSASHRWVWTLAEIQALPRFGGESGWFYGLVRHEGLHLAEVLPGYGYASPWWGWRLPNPYRVIRDINYFRPDRVTPRDEMVEMAEQGMAAANEAFALAEAELNQEGDSHRGDHV